MNTFGLVPEYKIKFDNQLPYEIKLESKKFHTSLLKPKSGRESFRRRNLKIFSGLVVYHPNGITSGN